jgi:hypothetical protein
MEAKIIALLGMAALYLAGGWSAVALVFVAVTLLRPLVFLVTGRLP